MTHWFGPSWGAPCCEPETHRPTPVGGICLWCDEPVREGEAGMLFPHHGRKGASIRPTHRECWLRQIFGSVVHQERRCKCFGGVTPDDPPAGMSVREEARVAVALYEERARAIAGDRLKAAALAGERDREAVHRLTRNRALVRRPR